MASSPDSSNEGYPGEEFCAGTYFNRKVTWWSQVRSFNDYIARCCHMLRQLLTPGIPSSCA